MITSVVTLSSLYYYNKLHNQINELSICDYDENSKQIGKTLTIITSFKQMVDTIKSNNLEGGSKKNYKSHKIHKNHKVTYEY